MTDGTIDVVKEYKKLIDISEREIAIYKEGIKREKAFIKSNQKHIDDYLKRIENNNGKQ